VERTGGGVAAPFATLPTPVLTAVADKLGLSVDALRSQLAAGRPLSSVAAVAGLAHEELVATVEAVRQRPEVALVPAERRGLLL
jgi:hypothetical protein